MTHTLRHTHTCNGSMLGPIFFSPYKWGCVCLTRSHNRHKLQFSFTNQGCFVHLISFIDNRVRIKKYALTTIRVQKIWYEVDWHGYSDQGRPHILEVDIPYCNDKTQKCPQKYIRHYNPHTHTHTHLSMTKYVIQGPWDKISKYLLIFLCFFNSLETT